MPPSLTDPSDLNNQLLHRLTGARSYLFIGAHPDDIEFYSGALVRHLVCEGKCVRYIVLTRGARGRSGLAKERLEGLRSQHQQDAADLLGVESVQLMDYPDGSLASHIGEAVAELQQAVNSLNPDTICYWDPEFIYNPHPDHVAASKIADAATGARNVVHFGTRRPNVWFGFGDELAQIKLQSIYAHKTESPWFFRPVLKYVLFKKQKIEGRKIGAKYAEVYRFKEKKTASPE